MDHQLSFSREVSPIAVVATASSILIPLLLLRIVHVVRSIHKSRRDDINNIMASSSSSASASISTTGTGAQTETCTPVKKVKTMVVLGSGGHTAEMIRLLRELDATRYSPVVYVVADSDATSIPRLRKIIEEDERCNGYKGRWEGRIPAENNITISEKEEQHQTNLSEVYRLPRAREVHQSYFSSIFTTLHGYLHSIILLWKVRPELILANGPGTCIPVIYSAFLLFRVLPSMLGVVAGGGDDNCDDDGGGCKKKCKIVFVESLCRVKTLSLTGKLAYPIVDRFVVHWPQLSNKYPMVEICDVFVQHDLDDGQHPSNLNGVKSSKSGGPVEDLRAS